MDRPRARHGPGAVFGKDDGVHQPGMLARLMYDGGRPPWTPRDGKGTLVHAWEGVNQGECA